jgi:mRNA interferase RelE/StbE
MPRNLALRIVKKLKQLAENPYKKQKNIKKLSNHPGFRLRIGDWRVVYTVKDKLLLIHVVKVKTRGEVYK